MENKWNNLVSLLSEQEAKNKGQKLYTFLLDGEDEELHLNYSQLEENSSRLASVLQSSDNKVKKALLLYPPSLDYITAFFACLKAKVIAVPAYPPDPNRLNRTLPRLLSIIRDSEAEIVLTTSVIKGMAEFLFQEAPELRRLEWIASDEELESAGNNFTPLSISPEDIAFIQYTSGSTGSPKGVVLSHRNLLANLERVKTCFGNHDKSQGVIWLPPYHDMGLIGGILQPLYSALPVTLMSPLDFLQKPLRWLKAISKYRGTASGGPNFAYELCVKKVKSEDLASLDLSSWELAFSGAEPIQKETIHRFVEKFKVCGFREEAFYPCYGLAESTLIVSGPTSKAPLRFMRLDKKALKANSIQEDPQSSFIMMGCGQNLPGQKLLIVNPESHEVLEPRQVGEIWIMSESVAQGYWQKPELTQQIFQAKTKDGQGPFLRTGDLGFLDEGELYVTGRIKDVIIIRGANYYPQDIEWLLENSDLALRTGCGAAFSSMMGGEERLVVVWEIAENQLNQDSAASLFQEMRNIISKNFDLHLTSLVLIKKASIPKTSSGKIQRHLCKSFFEDSSLEVAYQFQDEKVSNTPQELRAPAYLDNGLPLPRAGENDSSQMKKWLTRELSQRFNLNESEIDLKKPFSFYGIDSKEALSLAGDIEDALQVKLPPTLLWQYPDIDRLAEFLSSAVPLKTS